MTITYIDKVAEQVAATDTTIYPCPTTVSSAHVIFANCTCEDAIGDTITVNIVKSGGSVAVSNQYVSAKNIASLSSDPLSEIVGAILKPGDFISIVAATADRLNFKIGIKEIS